MKTKKGFGFVVPEDGNRRDIYVSSDSLKGAMHGDTVEVLLRPENRARRSAEGEITKVITRYNREVIGAFADGYVTPEDSRLGEGIAVGGKDAKGAENGDKVVVKILKYPDGESAIEGRITEIISGAGQPGGDIKTLIRQYGLREPFPAKVEVEAALAVKKDFDLSGREDLRRGVVFTIDGADAKDLDDAVSIAKNERGNFILGVHIADVSAYVEEGGALDREALKRGTSVYLIDQVVPMLPKALSNGICSLDRGEDRLTLSVDMEITPEGEIIDHRIYESLIRSNERMVYSDVSDILERRRLNLTEKYANIYEEILMMGELATALKQRRNERGSLDFDIGEAEIVLDNDGVAESVCLAERRSAEKMIEEFMLAANETVAEHFFLMGVPFVYRVHEKPEQEKIDEFKLFIRNFGLKLKDSQKLHPRMLSDLLRQTEGKPYENVVNMAMLRAMQKAYYGVECGGHFGLGLKYYCHFTAPIRRYPDMIVHRIIKEALSGPLDRKRARALTRKTETASEIASQTERKALELEREVEKMKKAEYMSGHIGEEFEGVISGIKPYGIFVELPNTVEGMAVEYYTPANHAFKLGDKVKVTVLSASASERRIDFAICN